MHRCTRVSRSQGKRFIQYSSLHFLWALVLCSNVAAVSGIKKQGGTTSTKPPSLQQIGFGGQEGECQQPTPPTMTHAPPKAEGTPGFAPEGNRSRIWSRGPSAHDLGWRSSFGGFCLFPDGLEGSASSPHSLPCSGCVAELTPPGERRLMRPSKLVKPLVGGEAIQNAVISEFGWQYGTF